jgi:hypothetical protein
MQRAALLREVEGKLARSASPVCADRYSACSLRNRSHTTPHLPTVNGSGAWAASMSR